MIKPGGRKTGMSWQTKMKQLAKMYMTNLQMFVEDFLSDHVEVRIPEFHSLLYKVIPKNKRNLIIAPRGFGKSKVCSIFFPLRQAIYALNKNIMIISASESLAIEFLREIANELILNNKIIAVFGKQDSKKWTEKHIILANGVHIRARGAGSQMRGFRPDLIIMDDLEDEETAESAERRKKLKTWIFKACMNSLKPNGQVVWVGTILNNLCLINEQFEEKNIWKKHKFQAYKNAIEEKGHELWPELWPHERLQEKKEEIGTFFFSHEYMNDPISDENAPIKEDMIRYWTALPGQLSGVLILDPAYSEEKSSDYKTAALIGIDHLMNRYLCDLVHTRCKTGEYFNAIINLWKRHQHWIFAIGIPNTGVEKEFYRSFLKFCDEIKCYPPVVEIKNSFTGQDGKTHKQKKLRMVAALQPLFERGKYYIHESHKVAKGEILQLGTSRHDDITDCMASGEQIIQGSMITKPTYQNDYNEPEEEEMFSKSTDDFGYGV